MRQLTTRALVLTLSALGGIAMAAGSASASDQVFRVDLNKTQIVRLPTRAGSIIVGNPSIADVSVHSSDMIFVVGRGFGETNLIILDRNGHTVMDADIQVTAVTPSHGVRLFNSGRRQTYSCAPYCQPSPVLGDDSAFIGANSAPTEKSEGLGSIFEDLMQGITGEDGGEGTVIAGGPVPSDSSGF